MYKPKKEPKQRTIFNTKFPHNKCDIFIPNAPVPVEGGE